MLAVKSYVKKEIEANRGGAPPQQLTMGPVQKAHYHLTCVPGVPGSTLCRANLATVLCLLFSRDYRRYNVRI
jgi:hypothetical protein